VATLGKLFESKPLIELKKPGGDGDALVARQAPGS